MMDSYKNKIIMTNKKWEEFRVVYYQIFKNVDNNEDSRCSYSK
jgi:hypothetical protein